MKISFLVSTRGQHPETLNLLLSDLSRQTLKNIEVVIVLQPMSDASTKQVSNVISIYQENIPIKLVITDTIGLSKSRNIAISHGTGEVFVLCDDDCRYPDDAAEKILKGIISHPEWDIATFRIGNIEDQTNFKPYPTLNYQHNMRTLMHVSSIEIALRRRMVQAEGKLFDERIGLGTPYITGGENIMLVDVYRKGYKIGYLPYTIVYHPIMDSARGNADLDQLIFSKAIVFRRMFGFMGIIVAAVFFIRRLLPGKMLRLKFRHAIPLIKSLFVRF